MYETANVCNFSSDGVQCNSNKSMCLVRKKNETKINTGHKITRKQPKHNPQTTRNRPEALSGCGLVCRGAVSLNVES